MSDDRAAEHRFSQEQEQDQAWQIAEAISKSKDSVEVKPYIDDVPSVQPETGVDVGTTLTCTKGNWHGNPTTYAYQWKSGTANVGDGTDAYTVVAGDAGKDITCLVTATNSMGSTEAPPSNAVAIPAAKKA